MNNPIAKTVIPKQTVPVVLRTGRHRIEGTMHVPYNHRVLDVLNGVPEYFIPITGVRIYDAATEDLVGEREFLAINKREIVFLYEAGPRQDPSPESPNG